MRKLPCAAAVLACVSLTACSSIDGQIAELREEETVVCAQMSELQTQRKSIERLVTALQQYKQSSTTQNSIALEKAREQYEAATR